jgi:hypothetical protein
VGPATQDPNVLFDSCASIVSYRQISGMHQRTFFRSPPPNYHQISPHTLLKKTTAVKKYSEGAQISLDY